jgi:hypothetical protein
VRREDDLHDPREGTHLQRQRLRGAEERRHRPQSALRYDTPEELALLNELWGYVNRRKNLFLATKKANRWRSTKARCNTRRYDKPKTPYQRQREEAGFLGDDAEHRLQVLYAQTNPAD